VSFSSRDYSRSAVLLEGEYSEFATKFYQVPNGFLKAFKFAKMNKSIFNRELSVTVVMSPSSKLTTVFKVITKSPVILDAGWPMVDGVLSRGLKLRGVLRMCYVVMLDFVNFHTASAVLLESDVQVDRVRRKFFVSKTKLLRNFTGCNEALFDRNVLHENFLKSLKAEISSKKPSDKVIVLFRGKVNKEAGISNILDAAQLLSDNAIFILVTGGELDEREVPNNCILRSKLTWGEMRAVYSYVDVCLGQISDQKRLDYTIPHKAFEAGYFAKPYITNLTTSLAELYSEDAVCGIEHPSAQSIKKAVIYLSDPKVREVMSQNISRDYQNRASQELLCKKLEKLASSLIS
jgi:hypothetical protein